MKPLVIAIDGPSGAGKGTVARALAAVLGYRHLDTGAMYRAVAWKALDAGISLDDEAAVSALASRVSVTALDGEVTVDGEDVGGRIRNAGIDRAAAVVARLPGVRQALVTRQRRDGAAGGIVIEGRDIGTVVFPGADVKIFLDASPDERARRRAADPAHRLGRTDSLEQVATAMDERDRSDRTRAASPLQRAPDAALVDTTGKSVDAVVAEVMAIVEARRGA